MTVTLINHSGRCLSLNLPHAQVCSSERCFCTTRPGRPPVRLCRSLTLPAGHALTALPESFLDVSEVRALVLRGDLEVRRTPPKSPADSASAPKRSRRKRGEPR